MIKRSRTDPHIVTLSASAYRLLLAFYPSRFRMEYGDAMAQVFRDSCLQTFRQAGPQALLVLWARTLADWIQTVIEEQFNLGTEPTRQKFIRLSGWAMILAAISLYLTFLPEADKILDGLYATFGTPATSDQHNLFLSISAGLRSLPFPIAILSITVGMIGLYVRYREQAGKTAIAALWIGVIGGAASLLANIGMLAGLEYGRMAMNILMAVMFGGLFVFGLAALQRKILPRWNALPLLAGFWWPFIVINAYLVPQITGQQSPGVPGWLSFAIFSIMSGSLGLLGYVLQADILRGKEIASL